MLLSKNKRLLIVLAFVSFGCTTLIFYSNLGSIEVINANIKQYINCGLTNKEVVPADRSSSYSRKWIVITSVNKPTKAVKAFSQMSGWQLLVVGDKKTPQNWSHKNVVYLGVEEQEKLPYSIVCLVPWNRYSRKLIGYLYAIQHGAEYIYESDDDNIPTQNISMPSQTHPYRLFTSTKNLTFNPYAHFGQSSTWPRGYPLDGLGSSHPREYVSCPTEPPAIVQNLVDGDPDVDALYRLTRRHAAARSDINFDGMAPTYLQRAGTYSPFNSQNTLFSKRAFWSMVLPISATDRATDIYRSYWTQRLMWIVGQRLAFGPSTCYHARSHHDLLIDFDQEKALYKDVGGFIKTLNSWECSSNLFDVCMLEVTAVVVNNGYWSQDDYNLVRAWISDLKQLDESLLNIAIRPAGEDCLGDTKRVIVWYPEEQRTSINYSPNIIILPLLNNEDVIAATLHEKCGSEDFRILKVRKEKKLLSDVVLLVSLYGDVESTLPAYEIFYKMYFKKIIYCMEKNVPRNFTEKWKVTIIFFNSGELSTLSCLTWAGLMNLNVRGFLHLSDSMFFNISSDRMKRDFETVWLPERDLLSTNSDILKLCDTRANRCRRLSSTLAERLLKNNREAPSSRWRSKIKTRIARSLMRLKEALSESKELTILIDIPIYFPRSKVDDLYQMMSIFTKSTWKHLEYLTPALLDFYNNEAYRLQAHSNKTSEDFDYRSDVKILSFLSSEFCKLFL